MPINEGITQKAIIDILLQKGSMEEPTLRGEIKKTLKLKDDSSIRVHISKLNESKCITKGNTQPGKANTWEISYDNLKHIVNKFPDMDLKSNTNAIELISERIKQRYAPDAKDILFTEDDGTPFYEMKANTNFLSVVKFALINSDSFFKACITTDFEVLKMRWIELMDIRLAFDDHLNKFCDNFLEYYECLPDSMLLSEGIISYIKYDILNGVVTEEERQFLKTIQNHQSIYDYINKKTSGQ